MEQLARNSNISRYNRYFQFKRRLDKFWQHQDLLYDYKVGLTGVGNRSQIKFYADDNIVIWLHLCTAYFLFAQAGHKGVHMPTPVRPLQIFALLYCERPW